MLPIDENILIETIEKTSPAVVNINTVRLVHDYYMNVAPLRGMGSGFIVDPKGYIMTNNHIVEGAEGIEVTLFDGRKFWGKLIGTDPTSDIAIVKIEGENLPFAKIGDSSQVKVGQITIAIGNPFGFLLKGPTVTVGVISAMNRTIQADRGVFENLFQTDAHINPGNSGGPLVNMKGEVIGIISANIPFAQGIGFSIPINIATRIADELMKHGRVIRPWLGIIGVGVNPEIARYYNLPKDKGILVTRVFMKSPAADAGLNPGDMIVECEKKELTDMEDLTKEIKQKKVGENISIVVARGQTQAAMNMMLTEVPAQAEQPDIVVRR